MYKRQPYTIPAPATGKAQRQTVDSLMAGTQTVSGRRMDVSSACELSYGLVVSASDNHEMDDTASATWNSLPTAVQDLSLITGVFLV